MADNGSIFSSTFAKAGGATNSNASNINNDQGKIFVGGLSWQTTEESLRWHFEQYGQVLSTEIMRDRHTGDPRGFGFVVFRDPATVDLVMNEDKHEINHKIVDVKRAQARGVAPPSIHEKGTVGGAVATNPPGNTNAKSPFGTTAQADRGGDSTSPAMANAKTPSYGSAATELTPEQLQNKVFVGGIPHYVDKDELRTIFEEFGPVVDSIVMMDQNGRSRGFGFVTFENGSNGAHRSVEAQPINIHGRMAEVKLAMPRAEQKRVLPAGPKHVGLRAGQISSSSASASGEFAGLAVAYGRSGWKAGYGSHAFGSAGWAVQGWESAGPAPERSGFSFDLLPSHPSNPNKSSSTEGGPPAKRARQ